MPTEQQNFPLTLKHPDLSRLPPLPPVPSGFRLRAWQAGDEGPVSLLMAEAFQDPTMAVYEDQLGGFHALPGVEPAGCFVLETADGLPVATAIGRIDPAFAPAGVIHQVAVRRAFWRRGLGSLTVLRAMHYIADSGRTKALVGFEDLEALLFYLNLGFAPLIEEGKIQPVQERAPHPWESAQVWREYYQLLDQTYPAQRPILQRHPLPALETYSSPATFSDPFIWHSDFIVDDDGDLVAVHATIDEEGVRFAGQLLTAVAFVKALEAHPIDHSEPIFLMLANDPSRPHGEAVQALLWSAGYARAGLVGPRQRS